MTLTAIDELEELHFSNIVPPFTLMGRALCDMGPYDSINFILSNKEEVPIYVVLGERTEDFNSILLRTKRKKEAERKYYHATSKYLFK